MVGEPPYVRIPVPTLGSLAFSLVFGLVAASLGFVLMAIGLGSTYSLDCVGYQTSGGACSEYALDYGIGVFLLLVGIVLLVTGAIAINAADDKYSLRSLARKQGILHPQGTRPPAPAVPTYANQPYGTTSAAPFAASSSVPPPSSAQPTVVPSASTPMTQPCPYCGTPNSTDYRFCRKCGRQLPPPV